LTLGELDRAQFDPVLNSFRTDRIGLVFRDRVGQGKRPNRNPKYLGSLYVGTDPPDDRNAILYLLGRPTPTNCEPHFVSLKAALVEFQSSSRIVLGLGPFSNPKAMLTGHLSISEAIRSRFLPFLGGRYLTRIVTKAVGWPDV